MDGCFDRMLGFCVCWYTMAELRLIVSVLHEMTPLSIRCRVLPDSYDPCVWLIVLHFVSTQFFMIPIKPLNTRFRL